MELTDADMWLLGLMTVSVIVNVIQAVGNVWFGKKAIEAKNATVETKDATVEAKDAVIENVKDVAEGQQKLANDLNALNKSHLEMKQDQINFVQMLNPKVFEEYLESRDKTTKRVMADWKASQKKVKELGKRMGGMEQELKKAKSQLERSPQEAVRTALDLFLIVYEQIKELSKEMNNETFQQELATNELALTVWQRQMDILNGILDTIRPVLSKVLLEHGIEI